MNGEDNHPAVRSESVHPFWPGLLGWGSELVYSVEASLSRLTTPLRIRILTTSDWTSLTSVGDTVWSNAVITATDGDGVTASANGDTLNLNQPLANAEDGKVVELTAEVTFHNPVMLGRILRTAPTALLARFRDTLVEFAISRGHLGWTHVQVSNLLGDEPTVIANEWWREIHGEPHTSKTFATPRRSIFNKVKAFDNAPVDTSTLNGKVMFGYQGWFLCPGDGSDLNRWHHWLKNDPPDPVRLDIDTWPDMRELDPDERFPTAFLLPNGEPAEVFSSYTQKTVLRHFEWMRTYNLDGVFAQRFISEIADERGFMVRNKVLQNVQIGAERYGRTFAVMYDISGGPDVAVNLIRDWSFLTAYLHITDSRAYLKHNGKPVVAIWGPGFYTHDNLTAQAAASVITWFKNEGVTLMGGVPTRWRMQGGDTALEPEWADVFRSYDIISPWSVKRYENEQELADFRSTYLLPDIQEAQAAGSDYMPVIWPGFSWHNMHNQSANNPLNEIPRAGGRFFNRQAQLLLTTAGVNMIYVAMFDEVDEGTAMFKLAEDNSMTPAGKPMVTLDIDGFSIPSHRYLQMAGSITQALREQQP